MALKQFKTQARALNSSQLAADEDGNSEIQIVPVCTAIHEDIKTSGSSSGCKTDK